MKVGRCRCSDLLWVLPHCVYILSARLRGPDLGCNTSSAVPENGRAVLRCNSCCPGVGGCSVCQWCCRVSSKEYVRRANGYIESSPVVTQRSPFTAIGQSCCRGTGRSYCTICRLLLALLFGCTTSWSQTPPTKIIADYTMADYSTVGMPEAMSMMWHSKIGSRRHIREARYSSRIQYYAQSAATTNSSRRCDHIHRGANPSTSNTLASLRHPLNRRSSHSDPPAALAWAAAAAPPGSHTHSSNSLCGPLTASPVFLSMMYHFPSEPLPAF